MDRRLDAGWTVVDRRRSGIYATPLVSTEGHVAIAQRRGLDVSEECLHLLVYPPRRIVKDDLPDHARPPARISLGHFSQLRPSHLSVAVSSIATMSPNTMSAAGAETTDSNSLMALSALFVRLRRPIGSLGKNTE